MSTYYGQDLPLYFSNGEIHLDVYSELSEFDPRVVYQAAIGKVLAHDENYCLTNGLPTADYPWAPELGCNVAGTIGDKAPQQTVGLETVIDNQCKSDPQMVDFVSSVDYRNGALTITCAATIQGGEVIVETFTGNP